MAKSPKGKGPRKRGDNGARSVGERPQYTGGEWTKEKAVADAVARIDQAVGKMVAFASAMEERRDAIVPRGDRQMIKRVETATRRDIEAIRRDALAEVTRAREHFAALIGAPHLNARERTLAANTIASKVKWAEATIATFHKSAVNLLARAVHWALFFLGGVFQFPELFFPRIDVVWQDFQLHSLGGVPVPIRKTKFNLTIGGSVVLNWVVVNFPHFPGWTPPPKILVQSGRVTAGGVVITALDFTQPQAGNPVYPAGAARPPVNFWGYGKIFYATGIPAGCRLRFRQVVRSRLYIRPAGGAWIDLLPGAAGVPSGTPFADPPGRTEHPSGPFGPGIQGMSDFPNGSIPPGAPVCTYRFRDDLFRTWVILVCPGVPDRRLGYWQWRWAQIQHMTAAGVVNVPAGPGGVPAPPGGWPAPGSGPTQWVDDANADPGAAADYGAVFP